MRTEIAQNPDKAAERVEFSLPSPGVLVSEARKAKGLRLEQVARSTRISVNNLQALEDDRYQDLPAETYVRGYLKLLAKEIEEDEALWLAAYDDISHPNAVNGPLETSNMWTQAPSTGLGRFSLPFRIGHVLAVVLAIIAFFLIYFALEGGSANQTTTAARPEGALIKMLDMRPVQRN